MRAIKSITRREHRLRCSRLCHAFFCCSASRFAFHSAYSRCPSSLYGVGSFRRRFYTALKNVGQVRKLSPHCCRHTYVTMLQANGVPMETIATLTGHSDIKTTEGYLHQSADTLAKAVEVLNGKAAS